jgi:glucose-6-phosphate isomerase
VSDLLSQLAADRLASRVWQRETAAFTRPGSAPAVHDAIRNRLGWLDAPETAVSQIGLLEAFAGDVRADGLTHACLLGMGGSSLCAEVLRDVPAARSAGLTLTVLDTTDERAIREATEALDPARTLFLVASKSGTTIEVSALERHFWSEMTREAGGAPGRHFAAITDPDTPLAALAAERHYRRVFINAPDIGGRYSVLSLFGLVPAALLGLDLSVLVESSRTMAAACREDGPGNPGLALGAFMAEHALAGRDKLTIVLPNAWRTLGAWIEQLVAESTGKDGRGVLPVVDEPLGAIQEYREDRAFVGVLTPEARDEVAFTELLERARRPLHRLTPSVNGLGAEFFRWEFATAVAGAAIGVNPFDEPNVRDAKVRTQAQLDARRATGRFRLDPPFDRRPGYLRRVHRPEADPGQAAASGPYLAILDYLPSDPRRLALVRRLRGALRETDHTVSTHGIGPRYLHSTGQYHKGGPATGRFVLLTAADASATPVPGTDYTFNTLKQAQALGDFDALVAAGRDVVHYHIEDPGADVSETLENLLRHL